MYGYIASYKSKCGYIIIMKRMYARETQSHSDTAHPLYVLLVSHTITVQGIRNDDQSLSPVTPLAYFSVVPNPLKCSGTFLIY